MEDFNVPWYTHNVDAAYYNAMRYVLLNVLPKSAPGLTPAEMHQAVIPHLPQDLFPKGEKAGWWAKAVQLDLDAKHLVVRESGKPLRWHKI